MKFLIYRMKWFLAQYFDFKSPVHLDLELNNSCNQKCLSCWHSTNLPFKIRHMSKDTAFRFLKEGAELGIMSVKFNLRGEPLLSSILVDCIREAKRLKYIDIMINTNGILLNDNIIPQLSDAGLTTMIISVDSLNKKTYCRLHGCEPLDYHKLIDNLFELKRLQNRLNYKIKLNFHINEWNKSENFILFNNFKRVVRYTENREGSHIGIVNHGKRKKKCPHMQRRLTVHSSGKIYPCCVSYLEPEDIEFHCYDKPNLKNAWIQFRYHSLRYQNGIYMGTCKNCTSSDAYKD